MDERLDRLAQKLPTGIYVVTAGRGDAAHVLTHTWLTQITTDPPRAMIGIRPYRKQHELLKPGEPFCVHLLGEDQLDLAVLYTDKEQPVGPEFERREGAAPLRRDVAAYLDCETEGFTTVGDHDMFVGRIVAGDQLREVTILTTAHFGDPYRTETV